MTVSNKSEKPNTTSDKGGSVTSDSKTNDKPINNQKESKPQGSRRGGYRPGAGRKKGKLSVPAMERLEAKKRFVARVAKNTDKLFNAQLNKALGETFLMVKITERGPKGGIIREYHEVVTNHNTILKYLDGELEGRESINDSEHFYYISTKPADNMAITNLLDRAYGKPTENVNLGDKDGEDLADLSDEALNARIDRYLKERRRAK